MLPLPLPQWSGIRTESCLDAMGAGISMRRLAIISMVSLSSMWPREEGLVNALVSRFRGRLW